MVKISHNQGMDVETSRVQCRESMRDSRNNRSYVTYVRSGMSGTEEEEEDGSKDKQTTRFVFPDARAHRNRRSNSAYVLSCALPPHMPPLRHYEYYGFVPGTSQYPVTHPA